MAETRASLAGPTASDDAAARAVLGWTPLVVAALATLAAGLSGLHARGLIGTAVEPWAFGYFVERFPLASALLVYAAARLVLSALIPPGPSRFLRLALLPIALALVLVPALWPTFGGVTIRAAYFTGGMSFLQGGPLLLAWPIGAIASGSVFALTLGLAVWLVRLSVRIGRRAALTGLGRLVALWFAAFAVALPAATGLPLLGDWPIWPMSLVETATATLLVLVALGPHALLVVRSGR